MHAPPHLLAQRKIGR